eukprot:2712990-Prymnesium_polylepis.2
MPTEASDFAKLSDLLDWERQQRSAANAKALALEFELDKLRSWAASVEHELQRQAAAVAAGGTTSGERVLKMDYERKLSVERETSAALQVSRAPDPRRQLRGATEATAVARRPSPAHDLRPRVCVLSCAGPAARVGAPPHRRVRDNCAPQGRAQEGARRGGSAGGRRRLRALRSARAADEAARAVRRGARRLARALARSLRVARG